MMTNRDNSVGIEVIALIEEGHALLQQADFQSAESCFKRAIEMDDGYAMAHNNLGWTYEREGKLDEAFSSYQRALVLDKTLTLARVNIASLMARTGRQGKALDEWNDLVDEGLFDRQLVHEAIDVALAIGSMQFAAKWADVCGAVTRGARHYRVLTELSSLKRDPIPPMLTMETLTHDIQQIGYLRRRGISDMDLNDMAERYERVRAAMEASGDRQRRRLNDEEQRLIGDTYGRIWHIRSNPRAESSTLWGNWDSQAVERAYFDSPLGLCVIDDFLSDEALNEVRQFCLESTVWFANHYSHGRLGAFFREGFNSHLLMSLADQLSQRLPALTGHTHRLLQLWGFKYSPYQPATHAHADFAAVNLNFWVTPDEANLRPDSGGLIVYDVEAPSFWDHTAYNKNGVEISAFLRKAGARSVYIPYRANRAILFNSDLFHATAPLHFRPEYENRRINVTMLFGRRVEDKKRPLRRVQNRSGIPASAARRLSSTP